MHRANFHTVENLPKEELSIATVRNCVLTRSMLVVTARGVHPSCRFENVPTRTSLKWQIAGAASLLKNGAVRNVEPGEYYFPFNPWSNNYFHWLTEIVPKFFLFERELRSGTIMIPETIGQFAYDFLEMFGFNNFRRFSRNTFFSELRVITNPNTNHYNLEHLEIVRSRMVENVPSISNAGRQIYVSRSGARSRKVSNEDVVISSLEKLGFDIVWPENMSLREQVEVFGNCGHLVSVHGAALANVLFMPPNTRLTELYPNIDTNHREFSACYRRLCSVLNIRHHFVFCSRRDESSGLSLDQDDLVVDMEDLSLRVRAIK